MAHELMYHLIHEKPFKRSVPSIPKGTRSGLTNYTTYLSKVYWIDTTRCYLNGRLNCDQLFELFGAYSGKSAIEVRRDMINYAKTMKEDVINSCHTGMRLKGYRCLSDWIDIMERESTPGDEFCLYLLGKTYFRHVFVMTGENTWCTCETDRPLSIKELLEISSLHLVYLGQGQYGLLRKRVNTIQQRTVQQVRQQRTPSAGTLFNRACNYRRVQSRPLNLSGIPNVGPVNYVNRGRGRGARNYTNRGRIHVNPVQQLQPHLQRQVTTSYNTPGFTITSECVEQVNPLVGKSKELRESIRHPEVAQLVTALLGRTDHTPKSSSAYKYPEVEQVVTNLLKKKSPATVDLTIDPNDRDYDHRVKAIRLSSPEEPNIPGVCTIDCGNTHASSGKVPDISPDPPDSLDSSLLSANHNHVEISDNEITCADKSPREDGELVTADDCSTSDTTEELLEEMGLLSKAGAVDGPKAVKLVTGSTKDVLTGNDTTTKPAIPDVGQKPMPESKADPHKSDHRKLNDASKNDPVITKREPGNGGVVSVSGQTTVQLPNEEDPVMTKRESGNGGVVQGSSQTTVQLPKTDDSPAIIIVSDTELTDTDTVIVKQEPKDGESNELDPKHTFHVLQEQILNLQCKVEMHKVKKETLVSLGTITLFSDTDDSDITAVQKPNTIAFKLIIPKKEPVPDSDNDEESDNVNKPNIKRKRNLIESSTDSDSDDNIPLADLRSKLTPLPIPVKMVTKPTIKQTKRKRKKRLFTTKPSPTQTSKPIVNRGNVPTSNIDDDNTSPLDSETGGETNATNKRDSGYNSGYNSTSYKDNKHAKSTENSDDTEPSTSRTSPSVTTSTGKKRKRNFYCIKCDVVEPSLKELNEHFRNTHDWVHCHNCGKPFPTPSALSKHMYTHGAKLLQCEQFPFESQLTSHMISHDEEGQFACDQCPKKLKNKSDLKKHLSAHTDDTFECKYCDVYVASDIRNLKGHLKTHDKLLRYVCRYCAKRFKHFNQRRRHQLKPNGCPKMPRFK